MKRIILAMLLFAWPVHANPYSGDITDDKVYESSTSSNEWFPLKKPSISMT